MDRYNQLKSLIKYIVNAQSEYLVHLLQIQMTKNLIGERTTNVYNISALGPGESGHLAPHHVHVDLSFIIYLDFRMSRNHQTILTSLLLKGFW